MLILHFPKEEVFDQETSKFHYFDEVTIKLEHSLVSLSKWESFYEKPFLSNDPKTTEETQYYVECMCIEEVEDKNVFLRLKPHHIDKVNEYLERKHTATWFTEVPGTKSTSNQVITSEIVYYWMVSLAIPFECQYWNLKRLMTLIRVINTKNQPQKKMSSHEAAMRAKELNAQRRKQFGTKG